MQQQLTTPLGTMYYGFELDLQDSPPDLWWHGALVRAFGFSGHVSDTP
jgi:hypothetical protein